MKIRLLLFVVPLTYCFGQEFHGFSLDGPAFPSTSNLVVPEIAIPFVSPQMGSIPYAYPVPATDRSGLTRRTQAPTILEFKNHTVDSALSYRLEGRTLHYVNLLNAKRTVPANRIDWTRTAKLNRLCRMPNHRMER
jgi:hypothetical protein